MMKFCFSTIVCISAIWIHVSADYGKGQTYFENEVLPAMTECSSELGFTMKDVHMAEKSGNYKELDLPCFKACVFKKVKLFDEKGMYDLEKALEMTQQMAKDAKEAKVIDDTNKICIKVNDQPVTDGDKGCERATMLFKCLEENQWPDSHDEGKEFFQKIVLPATIACTSKMGLSRQDLQTSKAEMHCVYACMLKEMGVINEKGMYDQVKAAEIAQNHFKDPKYIKVIEEVQLICLKVNDVPVSDGDKGCERADLIVKCLEENSGQFLINYGLGYE